MEAPKLTKNKSIKIINLIIFNIVNDIDSSDLFEEMTVDQLEVLKQVSQDEENLLIGQRNNLIIRCDAHRNTELVLTELIDCLAGIVNSCKREIKYRLRTGKLYHGRYYNKNNIPKNKKYDKYF